MSIDLMIVQLSSSLPIRFPKRLHSAVKMTGCVTGGPMFFLDPYAVRQWDDPNFKGTKINYDKVSFFFG